MELISCKVFFDLGENRTAVDFYVDVIKHEIGIEPLAVTFVEDMKKYKALYECSMIDSRRLLYFLKRFEFLKLVMS